MAMVVTYGVRKSRKHLKKGARRRFSKEKQNAHRHERRVARQILGTGADDMPSLVTSPVTERDVI